MTSALFQMIIAPLASSGTFSTRPPPALAIAVIMATTISLLVKVCQHTTYLQSSTQSLTQSFLGLANLQSWKTIVEPTPDHCVYRGRPCRRDRELHAHRIWAWSLVLWTRGSLFAVAMADRLMALPRYLVQRHRDCRAVVFPVV